MSLNDFILSAANTFIEAFLQYSSSEYRGSHSSIQIEAKLRPVNPDGKLRNHRETHAQTDGIKHPWPWELSALAKAGMGHGPQFRPRPDGLVCLLSQCSNTRRPWLWAHCTYLERSVGWVLNQTGTLTTYSSRRRANQTNASYVNITALKHWS